LFQLIKPADQGTDGVGKSTQVPQFVLDSGMLRKGQCCKPSAKDAASDIMNFPARCFPGKEEPTLV